MFIRIYFLLSRTIRGHGGGWEYERCPQTTTTQHTGPGSQGGDRLFCFLPPTAVCVVLCCADRPGLKTHKHYCLQKHLLLLGALHATQRAIRHVLRTLHAALDVPAVDKEAVGVRRQADDAFPVLHDILSLVQQLSLVFLFHLFPLLLQLCFHFPLHLSPHFSLYPLSHFPLHLRLHLLQAGRRTRTTITAVVIAVIAVIAS